MNTPANTLNDTLAIERDRCRMLVRDYGQIGSAGAFGAALVGQALGQAEAAARTGQPDSMQRALEALQRYTDLRAAADAAIGATPRAPRALPPRQPLCSPAQRFLQAA